MSLARTRGAYGRTTNCRRKVTAAHHVSGHAGKIGYALVLPGTRVDAFSKAVGEVLRDARRSCGMTLATVSVRSAGQFKASVLGGYERGEKKISLDRFTALADLYGFPSYDLLARVITLVASSTERRDEVIGLRAAEQEKRIMMD